MTQNAAKITVIDKVLAKLLSQPWVGADELEKMFPEKVEGHRSWGQRLRDLRKPEHGGYEIIYRTKAGTQHLTEWHLVEAPKIAPVVVQEAPSEAIAETMVIDTPEKQGEPINTENKRPAFMLQSGQYAFMTV